MNKEPAPPVAHGLGTYKWLKEDVIIEPLCISRSAQNGFMEASVLNASQALMNSNINKKSVIQSFKTREVRNYQLKVDVEGIIFSINVQEVGEERNVRKIFHFFKFELLVS